MMVPNQKLNGFLFVVMVVIKTMKLMNKPANILIITILMCILCACKKDSYELTGIIDKDVPCLLIKLTITDSDGADTLFHEYDDERRLVKYDINKNSYSIIEYDTIGRISEITDYYSRGESHKRIYTWGNKHLIVTEYSIEDNGELNLFFKYEYEFSGNKIVKSQFYNYFNNNWVQNGTTSVFTWRDLKCSLMM